MIQERLITIVFASIHSASAVALTVLFDMMEYPETLEAIRQEISMVRSANPAWTRQALGDLRLLDSFMRESTRVRGASQSMSSNTSPCKYSAIISLTCDAQCFPCYASHKPRGHSTTASPSQLVHSCHSQATTAGSMQMSTRTPTYLTLDATSTSARPPTHTDTTLPRPLMTCCPGVGDPMHVQVAFSPRRL